MIIWLDWRFLLVIFGNEIEKVLTANDIGNTNSHQAGFLVPHKLVQQGLFPVLEDKTQNPRVLINLIEIETNKNYLVNYIKYNNKRFGGTRYEYRITGVRGLLRHNLLRPGDSILFRPIDLGTFGVSFIHRNRKILEINGGSWIIKREVENGL
jgi:hypothetical protein